MKCVVHTLTHKHHMPFAFKFDAYFIYKLVICKCNMFNVENQKNKHGFNTNFKENESVSLACFAELSLKSK